LYGQEKDGDVGGRNPVGASLLAKVVNDDARSLDERGVRQFFASKLAPTEAF
jgi:hypothetical protein